MKQFPSFLLLLVTSSSLAAQPLLDDTFSYANGPLSGQGPWVRGVTSPSADNPSDFIVVDSGAVKFDWTTTSPVNNALRMQWADDQMTSGMIYAAFTLRVAVAPLSASGTRPGFLHFDRSGGGQMRGHVGIRPGTEPGTFQVGISPSSQLGDNFTFSESDLVLNTVHQLMIGYDVASSTTSLWIGTTDPDATPETSAIGSPSDGVRRIQLRLYNFDGATGTTDLGVFYLDNLVVTTGPALNPDPEPETAEVFLADTFAYDDGPLLDSAPEWRIREGAPAHSVAANQLQLHPVDLLDAGYLTRNLSRTVEMGSVYTAFTLDLPAAAQIHDPVNALFLTDVSGAFGRAFVVIEGTADGWRIGLRGSTSGTITWESSTLSPGSSTRWVTGFDVLTGSTGMWLDTDAVDAPARVEITGSAMQVRRLAIGADPNLPDPAIAVRDLHIAAGRETAVSPPVDLVTLPHPDKVFLFLLIGQSNMAGRGAIEAEDLIGNRRIAFYNADRQWQVARDPLHWDRPTANGVGPALSFARALLPNLPPDAVIGLIPAAQGATSITWWQKSYAGAYTFYDGQYLYPHALGRALEAAQVGTFAGILWNQGENDAGAAEADGGASYRTKLHQLIADLRNDLNRPGLPFIVSTLGPWRTNAAAINSVFLSLPSEVSNTAAVDTNDPAVAPFLVNNPNDTPHYISSSYRLLGQLYAAAFQPWWSPAQAYVQTLAGNIRAGGPGHGIQFTATGGISAWQVYGSNLLAPNVSSTGEWFLNGAISPEVLAYSENPPLAFKWRSPRTMAAWTAGEGTMGVVLANNDTFPAIFRLSIDSTHLTAFRAPGGEWQPVAEALADQPVDRLKWSLPGGSMILWSGTAALIGSGNPGSPDLEAHIAPKGIVDWSWQYGAMPLLQPQPHAVYQRQSEREGRVPIEGLAPAGATTISFSISDGSSPFGTVPPEPVVLAVDPISGAFAGSAEWPAGGWYTILATARDASDAIVDEQWIDPVGIGEVFIVAGQSNSTNSGQFQTRQQSGLVSAFSGSGWRPATDPMPGTHDNATRGSFQPSMGDALVAQFGVPVAFASTGQGGSAIRHWQPDYEHDFVANTFYNGLYQWTLHRIRQLGQGGFRALLWHQGESNAAQGESTDPSKVDTYYASLSNLLGSWRADAGWHLPVFTAKASLWPLYNAIYGGDPYLRQAQQQIWDDGIALPGPDTDQLGLEYRQDDSDSRVHFNAAGLKLHGELWADSVSPFISELNLLSLVPRLEIGLDPGGMMLQWSQVSDLLVQLQSSTSLSGGWVTIETFQSDEVPESYDFTDLDWDGTGPRFYRLMVEP